MDIRRRPYLAIGWFWYLGTLVPVIGIVQVGRQAMADRYTYLPLIGFFIAIVWGSASLIPPNPVRERRQGQAQRPLLGLAGWLSLIVGAVSLSACAILSWRQVGYWKDTNTLFTHTIEVTGSNVVAENILGTMLAKEGKLDRAIVHLDKAMQIEPDYQTAKNLGRALAIRGRFRESILRYEDAVRLRSDDAAARAGLGEVFDHEGRNREAVVQYSESLRLAPGDARLHASLGSCLAAEGRTDEAIAHYEEALRLAPISAPVHNDLGAALAAKGNLTAAIGHYEQAARLDPRFAAARYNLGMALLHRGDRDRAVQELGEAVRLEPGNQTAQEALRAAVLARDNLPGKGRPKTQFR